MRHLIIILLLSGCTSLEVVQTTGTALTVADWAQTRWISEHRTEANPYLGENPHKDKVNAYFAALLTANTLINLYTNDRARWCANLSTVMTHGRAVRKNYRLGVQFDF